MVFFRTILPIASDNIGSLNQSPHSGIWAEIEIRNGGHGGAPLLILIRLFVEILQCAEHVASYFGAFLFYSSLQVSSSIQVFDAALPRVVST
jgi:hypothetical protein